MIKMKKKIIAIILVSMMLIEFIPLLDTYSAPTEDLNPEINDTPFAPPNDKTVPFSNSPNITFFIDYSLPFIYMEIDIINNLAEPLSLFNLWIQVNKSDEFEYIRLVDTKITDDHNKLSLSTFDNYATKDLSGNGSMIFHIKLCEGQTIAPDEQFNVLLSWYDSYQQDKLVAQYNPDYIHNNKRDDIQAFFQYSTKEEESQPFPLVEKHFYQEYTEEGFANHVDFRISNLMDSSLDSFNFSYSKIKESIIESYEDFYIESPFLDNSEKSDISLTHQETNERIEYDLSFGDIVSLNPDEWLWIKTIWLGSFKDSSIDKDFITWDFGETDNFNKGFPFYLLGFPFYPILSPAEPIITFDYDFDGLSNALESEHGFDYYTADSWLTWSGLRSDYLLNGVYAKSSEISGEVSIFTPTPFFGAPLNMSLTQLGSADQVIDIEVNEQKLPLIINTPGTYTIVNSINDGCYTVKFKIKHDSSTVSSSYEMDFQTGNTEIPDLTSIYEPDSDGDGLFDLMEKVEYNYIPDADLDGIFDGADLMPYNSYSYSANEVFKLNFPIKNENSESDISVNIQLKPTINDYTRNLDYAANKLIISPGLRVYNRSGGDYLPDNCFSLDSDKTGLVNLIPLQEGQNKKAYSWSVNLNYKNSNLAKEFGKIKLRFSLVWLIYEYNPVTEESKFFHVYNNTDSYEVQGISIIENEPTTIALGIVDNGQNHRKTTHNAELAAQLSVSDMSYAPNDISHLEIFSDILYDIKNLNDTRDNLRQQILNTYSLNYDTTDFIYLTYGYSLSYNLETLFNAFSGEDFSRTYTPADINSYYLRPENSFTGMIAIQTLKGFRLEFIKQYRFGEKLTTEVKDYILQFSKFNYVGSSSEEIFLFNGQMGTNPIEINSYDLESKSDAVQSFDVGGNYETFTDLQIFRFEISLPEILGPAAIWGDFLTSFLMEGYENAYVEKGFEYGAKGAVRIYDKVKKLELTKKAIKEAAEKVLAVIDIIFSAMKLVHGISLYFQGAYNTGLAMGIREGLNIITGILVFFPDPTGITKVVAVVIMVFTGIDALLDEIFGFDLWASFLSFFWGIEDANPDYDISNSRLVYDQDKIKAQGGFEVGDYIGVSMDLNNKGNTRLTFGLKVRAGGDSYGGRSLTQLDAGNTGSIIATDTFQSASPIINVYNIVDLSWYYNPPGRLVVNIIPPFFWWVDPPASGDGPYYGGQNSASFSMPVVHSNIANFIAEVESGAWFPAGLPITTTTVIEDELTPGESEEIHYNIRFWATLFVSRSFKITTPNNDLWTYEFNGNVLEEFVVDLPWYHIFEDVDLKITPKAKNVLRPGDNSIAIRVEDLDIYYSRTNIKLDYKVIPIFDFEVVFDPFKPVNTELNYDEILVSYINVTNIGNVLDRYDVEVIGLYKDLFFLHEPVNSTNQLHTGVHAVYSTVIGFQIPYWEITMPGTRLFSIKVSSLTDPTVIKTFACSILITEYHLISFAVDEPDPPTITDSETHKYYFDLFNVGNVNEEVTISYTPVDIATLEFENDENFFSMTWGQEKYFYIELTPFELGYREFNITASSPFITETIEASINIIDDDTQYPYFEYFSIEDNHNWLNLSFIAKDDLLGDDQGLSNISVYVDDVLVYNYIPPPTQTIFNFSIPNDWIWRTEDWIVGKRTYNVKVNITDADDDRITIDSLSTLFSDPDTFEVTLDEMYNYIVWLLDEMNNYIYNNSISALYGVVTQKIVKIQDILLEAYQLIEDGYLHTGLVRSKIAEAKLEIADTKTELMINKQSMSLLHFDYLKGIIQNIRNKILEIMGLSMGTPFSHAISLAEVEIYNVRDFVDYNIDPGDSENLANALTLAAEKLEDALFDISLDKDTESSITTAQRALDRARAEVVALVDKGKISQDLATEILIEIVLIHTKIEELKNMV